MNIKNQNHCHKKRNSRQTTDHINNHSFCAFNKMQRSWDILFFCPLLFGSGLFLLTKIWMLLVLLFGYFMTCFAINLVYTSALGGVFYLVLGCGIKATWWDKLRSMWFSGYLLMTLISILSHYSFDTELFKFIIADMLIFIHLGCQIFCIIHPSCISALRNRYSDDCFLII